MVDCLKVENSIVKTYRRSIYAKFIEAIEAYKLIDDGDCIGVCISGGKDSFLMAKLFQQLSKQKNYHFKTKYIVMNPGYSEENLEKIKQNLKQLEIPATISDTDIFAVSMQKQTNPCFYCAKYRRSALLRIAEEMGCNKIALGHHYDDVIATTLMNMLNNGSFQTMLPKHISDSGMEVIRPLYLIREKAILKWVNHSDLQFINCACKLTDSNNHIESKRAETRRLIEDMKKYNINVEQNIFSAAENINLDKILGYKSKGREYSFLDLYEKKK